MSIPKQQSRTPTRCKTSRRCQKLFSMPLCGGMKLRVFAVGVVHLNYCASLRTFTVKRLATENGGDFARLAFSPNSQLGWTKKLPCGRWRTPKRSSESACASSEHE